MSASAAAIAMGPTFDVPVVNVSVVVGQTALLPCSILHLGRHKVCTVNLEMCHFFLVGVSYFLHHLKPQ